MDNTIFDAIPGSFCPISGALEYRKQLKNSFLSYVKNIEKSLDVDLQHIAKNFSNLALDRKYVPGVFASYALITDAYTINDVQGVFDGLQMLTNTAAKSLYSDSIQFGTILTDIWELPFIQNLRSSPMIDEYGNEYIEECKMAPLCHWQDNDFPPVELKEAIDLLKTIDPLIYAEYLNYAASIKLFSAKIIQGATSPRFFGNIYLRLPYEDEDPVLFYLEHIVHEVSHLHLYAMMQVDKIILNDENELFSSPLRKDKRPMIGVFHSVFVLSRIIRVLKTYIDNYPHSSYANQMLNKVTDQFNYGYSIVHEYGILTEKGELIKKSFHKCALMT